MTITTGFIEMLESDGRFERLVEAPSCISMRADAAEVRVIADVEALRLDLEELFHSLTHQE